MSTEGDRLADYGDGGDDGRTSGEELAIYIENGEVLVSGPTEAATAYVERLRDVGAEISTEMLTGRRVADIAAVLATVGVAKQTIQGGVYLRVAEESLPHLIKDGLMPTKDGLHTFLGMTRSGSQISHHIRFTGMTVSPAQMLSIQMVAVQIALRMAIAEVLDSIKRVEGKVDALLKLAYADKAGNVLGLHETLTHYCELLDQTGVVTSSDWNSIASTGSQLAMVINQLRKHVSISLAEVVVSAPINHRADAVGNLLASHRIDQTLSLLVVVEDAMFKFQQLRVAHVQRTEPEFLEATVMSARQILADNSRTDEGLYTSAHATLNAASIVRPLEIHRVMSVSKLSKSTEQLKEHLDEFSRARRLQVADWRDVNHPTIADAAAELGQRVQATGQKIDAANNRVIDKGFARLDAIGRSLQEAASRRLASDDETESETEFRAAIGDERTLQVEGKRE